MARISTVLAGILLVLGTVSALPVPQSDRDTVSLNAEDDMRLKRQGLPPLLTGVRAEPRDDPYAPPAYHAPPSYHKGGPVYVRTFVKTDYKGNFKWGVKHNIDDKGYH